MFELIDNEDVESINSMLASRKIFSRLDSLTNQQKDSKTDRTVIENDAEQRQEFGTAHTLPIQDSELKQKINSYSKSECFISSETSISRSIDRDHVCDPL